MMQFCIPEIPSRHESASTQKHGIGNSLFRSEDFPMNHTIVCVCVVSGRAISLSQVLMVLRSRCEN